MKQDKKIIERLELAAKIAKEGLNFQVLCINDDDASWEDCPADEIMKFTDFYTCDEFEMRLVPQPVMVPLEVSDIPPGTVIRNYAWNETDWVPVAVGGNFVIRLDTGERLTFESLMLSWQIQRLGGGWEACMKEK